MIAYSTGSFSSAVNVYQWSGAAWTAQATGLGAGDLYAAIDPSCSNVTTLHLTNSPVVDFAVNICTMPNGVGTVVSDAGGSWHLLSVQDGPDGPNAPSLPGATFGAGTVTAHVNTCTPDCAEGNYAETTFAYDPASGMLVATGPTTIQQDT